jgi:hypothetical protein
VVRAELHERGIRPEDNGLLLRSRVRAIFRKYSTGSLADRAEGSVALAIDLARPSGYLEFQGSVIGRSEQPIELAMGEHGRGALEAAVRDAVARLAAAADFRALFNKTCPGALAPAA